MPLRRANRTVSTHSLEPTPHDCSMGLKRPRRAAASKRGGGCHVCAVRNCAGLRELPWVTRSERRIEVGDMRVAIMIVHLAVYIGQQTDKTMGVCEVLRSI